MINQQIYSTIKGKGLDNLDRALFSDSHCHLYMSDNPKKTLSEAKECKVGLLIDTAVDFESSRKVVELELDHKSVLKVIGISPEAALYDCENIDKLQQLLEKNVIGIGEIGLDSKIIDRVPIDKQRFCFEKQLDIAVKQNIPVVIHSRGMLKSVESILFEKGVKSAMFHFFEGNEDDAKRIEKNGYLISIPPLESSRFKRVIAAVDLESIVCETDFPAVGKTPCDVIKTIENIAKIKNKDITSIGDSITETIKDYFGV